MNYLIYIPDLENKKISTCYKSKRNKEEVISNISNDPNRISGHPNVNSFSTNNNLGPNLSFENNNVKSTSAPENDDIELNSISISENNYVEDGNIYEFIEENIDVITEKFNDDQLKNDVKEFWKYDKALLQREANISAGLEKDDVPIRKSHPQAYHVSRSYDNFNFALLNVGKNEPKVDAMIMIQNLDNTFKNMTKEEMNEALKQIENKSESSEEIIY
ncbi:7738_t:CDS:2 [Funneliformis caledonium]|uniref:7738_t:CDS:1 n=1 Tax=Funneliformis caledonium TaxID=1117310 RepID=A0A9N9B184_9GLOM|nr:7738_t:CDS:2 [Funneliformis caledonium]